MISLIVAVADNDVIGSTGESMPWTQSDDLKHFREVTMGHPIIMGRKTYDTIRHPLVGRTTIIVTHDQNYLAEGCIVAHSLEDSIEEAKKAEGADEIFIIGGANLFQQALPIADKLYLTKVHGTPEGDIKFTFDASQWKQTKLEQHKADEKNQFDYDFAELVKNG